MQIQITTSRFHRSLLRFFLPGFLINSLNNNCNLYFRASLEGYPEIVRFLLQNGANGKANGGAGLTPLYAACFVGHLEVVRILVESLGHLLMQPTVSDQSVPLHAAILQGKIEVIRYLLSLRKEVTAEEPCTRPRKATVPKRNSRGQEGTHQLTFC